jgi:RNA polymerase sigma factor (sigma-70 family)
VAALRASAIVARHERSLMRVALHWSLCQDDAHDAFQRAIEIYLRRAESLDPATELAWLKVVVKHEALAVRRARAEVLPNDDVDASDAVPDPHRPIDELLDGRERVSRSAEALRRIKPDEARALMLKAKGLSYEEIGSELDWSYTKVNRCLTEGRARFLKVYAEIEAGESCERFAPTLAALAAGTADADALLEIRPHIRNCAACRATVRDLHATRLGRLAAVWPIPALVGWVTGRGGIHVTDLEPSGGGDRVGDLVPTDAPDLYEAISRTDALPSADTLDDPSRWLEFKTHVYGWIQRLHGTDVVTSAQVAAGSSGGGRIATLGAIVALCLSSVGAGTVCVVEVLNVDRSDRAVHRDNRLQTATRMRSAKKAAHPSVPEVAHRDATVATPRASVGTGRDDPRRTTVQAKSQRRPPAQSSVTKEFQLEEFDGSSGSSAPRVAASEQASRSDATPASFETSVQRETSASAPAIDPAQPEFGP